MKRLLLTTFGLMVAIGLLGACYDEFFIINPGSQTVTVHLESRDGRGRDTHMVCDPVVVNQFTGSTSMDTSPVTGTAVRRYEVRWGAAWLVADCSIPVVVSPSDFFVLPGQHPTVTVRPAD